MTLIDGENIKILNKVIDNLFTGDETCSTIFKLKLYDKNNS